jgi:hypothetical protein
MYSKQIGHGILIMTEPKLALLIARFTSGEQLSDEELSDLSRSCSPGLVDRNAIRQNKVIDNWLRLLGRAASSDFVARCVDKFESTRGASTIPQFDQPNRLVPSTRTISKPPNRSKLDNVVSESLQPAPRSEGHHCRISERPLIVVEERKPGKSLRRTRRRSAFWVSATAAASFFLLVACVLIIAKGRVENGVGGGRNRGGAATVAMDDSKHDGEPKSENDRNLVDGDLTDRQPAADNASVSPQELQQELVNQRGSFGQETELPSSVNEVAIGRDRPGVDNSNSDAKSETLACADAKGRLPDAIADADDSRRSTYAAVLPGKAAVWEHKAPPERIGEHDLILKSGTARLQFDNGTVAYLLGPAEVKLSSREQLVVSNGKVLVEISASSPQFQIASPDAVLSNPDRAHVQLIVDVRKGTEALLSRGAIDVLRSGEFEAPIIRLTKNKLNQVLIDRPPATDSKLNTGPATVSLARGRDWFLGQVQIENDSVEVDSPHEFQRIVDFVGDSPLDNSQWREKWHLLVEGINSIRLGDPRIQENQQLEKLVDELFIPSLSDGNLRDGALQGTTQFKGTMSINGKTVTFDSQEEFERARKRAFGSNLSNDINVRGRSLKFTPLDEFRMDRRKMK